MNPVQSPAIRAIVSLAIVLAVRGAQADSERRLEFNRDVRPILADKCFACHGPDSAHREADLRLDVRESALEDRGSGAAIVPGNPESSALVSRITATADEERMPPPEAGKPLTAAEIDTLRRWIREGAEYQPHWAYIPPQRSTLPSVRNAAWCRDPLDFFILERLERLGLEPSEEASRATLLRRLSFDLIGLPPTPAELDAFLADTRPDAYERAVDRLLASPHFGERLAISWLDLVRYADTVGYHGDQEHPASPYRDYVIDAFNDNMPFDQFTREQLAGDLLPQPTVEQRIATCYNRVLQTSHEGGVQVKEYLAKYSADRVRNLGGAWLGATLGCCECHNHKYDPFTQRDFYRFAAFFADVDDLQTFRGGDTTPTRREPEIRVLRRTERRLAERYEAELQQLVESAGLPASSSGEASAGSSGATDEANARKAELEERLQELQRHQRRVMVTVAIEPRPIRVLHRGDWMDESGEIVDPGVPDFLPPLDVSNRRATRLDLANWLVAPEHPLTSRVFVNRIWAQLMGEGLCPSLDDFGSQGEWPVHLALLDQLSVDFVSSGWDIKHLIRRIVCSSTYRQSSLASPELLERDPRNRYFARQARFRLPAELIRDNALAISGLLVTEIGGPSSHPYQPEGYYAPLNFPKRTYRADQGAQQYRRGVYTHWQRQFLHPMLKAFDAPSREECTARRPTSNTPLAALTLLNDPSFVECARRLAERVLRRADLDQRGRYRFAWRLATSREPEEEELRVLDDVYRYNVDRYRRDQDAARQLLSVGQAPVDGAFSPDELAAWTQVARALLNLNEVITRN